MIYCLKLLWRPQAQFDMMSIGNGQFMVKLNSTMNREKVIRHGSWILYDHYLAIK